MQVGRLTRIVDAGRTTRGTGVVVLVQQLHDINDGPVLQKGQLARPEVVEQSPKRLRPHSYLRMQPPTGVGIERHTHRQ
jgi:hypothetical protein